jgi:hypothetical protein
MGKVAGPKQTSQARRYLVRSSGWLMLMGSAT